MASYSVSIAYHLVFAMSDIWGLALSNLLALFFLLRR